MLTYEMDGTWQQVATAGTVLVQGSGGSDVELIVNATEPPAGFTGSNGVVVQPFILEKAAERVFGAVIAAPLWAKGPAGSRVSVLQDGA